MMHIKGRFHVIGEPCDCEEEPARVLKAIAELADFDASDGAQQLGDRLIEIERMARRALAEFREAYR